MARKSTILIGKGVRVASRLKGGGSALPGLVVEKIDKNFLAKTLEKLPRGVVIVSGTNGKTTTTKIVTELLQSQGIRVFTNATGSNFKRGVISALLSEMTMAGKLNADIAVLELDEAHAVHFVKEVAPKYCLLLNVMRDQLDRFGEIDTTAKMLAKIAEATTGKVVLNREDVRIARLAKKLDFEKVEFFGLSPELLEEFPSDNDLYSAKKSVVSKHEASVILNSFEDQSAEFFVDGRTFRVKLKVTGIYNVFNVAAAIGLVSAVCGEELNVASLQKCIETIEPAFGRGENVVINGRALELVLVKNPAGFRLALKSFDPKNVATMIAINDNYADGRDMSWLWDVDFSSLGGSVSVVSGSRAYDMALRLKYDEIGFGEVDDDLSSALEKFIKTSEGRLMRIYCTYTAMLSLRKLLKKYTTMERVL